MISNIKEGSEGIDVAGDGRFDSRKIIVLFTASAFDQNTHHECPGRKMINK